MLSSPERGNKVERLPVDSPEGWSPCGQYSQAGVHPLPILLVLQASFCQVNGKYTGDSNQSSYPSIDQLGR